MTSICHHKTNCTNRFCAFYHSEKQKKQAQENRESLERILNSYIIPQESKVNQNPANLLVSVSKKSKPEPLNADITSINHFPSLPPSESSEKVKSNKQELISNQQTKSNFIYPAKISPPNEISPKPKLMYSETLTHSGSDSNENENSKVKSPGFTFSDADFHSSRLSPGFSQDSHSDLSSELQSGSPFGFEPINFSPAPGAIEYLGNESNNNSFYGSSGFTYEGIPKPSLVGSSSLSSPWNPLLSDVGAESHGNSFFLGIADQFSISDQFGSFTGSSRHLMLGSGGLGVVVPVDDQLKLYRNSSKLNGYDGTIYEGLFTNELGDESLVHVKALDHPQGFSSTSTVTNIYLKYFHHGNLVQYYKTLQIDGQSYVLMHYYPEEDSLRNWHTTHFDHPIARQNWCKSVIYQLCTLLVYLHEEQHIAHLALTVSKNQFLLNFMVNFFFSRKLDNIFVEKTANGPDKIIAGDVNRNITVNRSLQSKLILSISEGKNDSKIFTSEAESFLQDFYSIAILIIFLFTGCEIDSANFGSTTTARQLSSLPVLWKSFVEFIYCKKSNRQITPSHLLLHPVFWSNSVPRVSKFLEKVNDSRKQLVEAFESSFSIQDVFGSSSWPSKIDPKLFPMTKKHHSYRMDDANVLNLIEFICYIVKNLNDDTLDEYLTARQDARQVFHSDMFIPRDPLVYFLDIFPNLLVRVWEVILEKQLELQRKHHLYSTVLGGSGSD
jgi:hypothetical protein